MQIQLTGFLDKDTAGFCKELWKLCLSAQTNPQGVPKELLEAKKLELIQEKVRLCPILWICLADRHRLKQRKLRKKLADVERKSNAASVRSIILETAREPSVEVEVEVQADEVILGAEAEGIEILIGLVEAAMEVGEVLNVEDNVTRDLHLADAILEIVAHSDPEHQIHMSRLGVGVAPETIEDPLHPNPDRLQLLDQHQNLGPHHLVGAVVHHLDPALAHQRLVGDPGLPKDAAIHTGVVEGEAEEEVQTVYLDEGH